MEQTDAEADSQLASSLRMAIMRIARRLRVERTEDTPGLSQISALATLGKYGPLSPTALADHERIQPPSMTRVIAALEERGYIQRGPHPSDRRQAVIAITPEGTRVVEAERQRRQEWFSRVLDGLTVEEREQLRSVIPVLDRLCEW